MAVQDKADTLEGLLHNELAAVAAYEQALKAVRSEAAVAQFRRISSDHRDAAKLLREHIVQSGREPSPSPEPGTRWVLLNGNPAGVLDPAAVCAALQEAEQATIGAYEEALRDPELLSGARNMIHFALLPWQRQHIRMLGTLPPTRQAG